MLASVPLKIDFLSRVFIVFVTSFVNDARIWSAGPTQRHMKTAKSTKKENTLLKKSIFIWKRATTMTLLRLLVNGTIDAGPVLLAGVARVHRGSVPLAGVVKIHLRGITKLFTNIVTMAKLALVTRCQRSDHLCEKLVWDTIAMPRGYG